MRTLAMILGLMMVVTSAHAAETKSRVDCSMPLKGNTFRNITSDKSFTFKRANQGSGLIRFQAPVAYPDQPQHKAYEHGGVHLELDSRFNEKIRLNDVVFNMSMTEAAGAVVPSKRAFTLIPKAIEGAGMDIVIQEQGNTPEQAKVMAVVHCKTRAKLPVYIQDKIGANIAEVAFDSYNDSYSYLNECLKLIGLPVVACPTVNEVQVASPKRATRKEKPSTPAGMAGDDVSASVPNKSGMGQ